MNRAPRIYNLFPRLAGPFTGWEPHLKRASGMGFNWLFINPISYPGFSGSLYAVKDFYQFNPLFVSSRSKASPEKQFSDMVGKAHKQGLGVMVDLVVNHSASDSPLVTEHPGWYKHAHDWLGNQDEDVYWGRGNGWVAAATADYLRVLLARGEKDKDAQRALDKLFSAIISTQDGQSGLWWTVVNRPGETYLETSASALFACALARAWRYGFTDDSVLPTVESAVAGVRAMVTTDALDRPVVTGISGPTMAGSFEYYKEIPVIDDLPFGLGVVLLMLIETSGLF